MARCVQLTSSDDQARIGFLLGQSSLNSRKEVQTLAASQNVGANPDTTTVIISPFIGMADWVLQILVLFGGFLRPRCSSGPLSGSVPRSSWRGRVCCDTFRLQWERLQSQDDVAASLLGLFCFGIVGDSTMSESQMEAFLDTPLSYKGKTLTMELAFEGEPVSGWVENGVIAMDVSVPFRLIGRPGHNIYATIPAGMKVPSLVSGDFVRVTFICKEGSQGSGNIITTLARQ